MAELFSSPIPLSAAQETKLALVAEGPFLEWYRENNSGELPPGWDDADGSVRVQARIDLVESKLIDVLRRVYRAVHENEYRQAYEEDTF
jgi:hypothetical protein